MVFVNELSLLKLVLIIIKNCVFIFDEYVVVESFVYILDLFEKVIIIVCFEIILIIQKVLLMVIKLYCVVEIKVDDIFIIKKVKEKIFFEMKNRIKLEFILLLGFVLNFFVKDLIFLS